MSSMPTPREAARRGSLSGTDTTRQSIGLEACLNTGKAASRRRRGAAGRGAQRELRTVAGALDRLKGQSGLLRSTRGGRLVVGGAAWQPPSVRAPDEAG